MYLLKAMEPELRDIIRAVASESTTDGYTHVTLYGPHARWAIRPHTQSAFWTGYCELVDKFKHGDAATVANPLANMCLAERPQEVMPTIANFTFRFHADPADDNNWEPYDDTFLHWICHIYQTVLGEMFAISTEQEVELVAVIMESSTHWYEENRDTGERFMVMEVRMQFPYARVDAGMQTRLVRPRVIQLLRSNNVMAKIQRQPVGDWDQIISSDTVNTPVVMYGSSEVPGRPKLEQTHLWHHITSESLESGATPAEIALEDAFVPNNHTHVQQQAVKADIFENDVPLAFWMPMFLSIGYWPSVLLPKEDIKDNGRFTQQVRLLHVQADQQQRPFGAGGRNAQRDDDSEAELAERLIPMINPQRFLRESFWLDIGKALYVANEGAENGLLSWIRHTERSVANIQPQPVYLLTAGTISETCRNLYYTFANSAITVKTLAWYAREDSPDRYGTWHRDWCLASMEQALSVLHTDVAIALHRIYWLDYAYCPVGTGRWFQFHNQRWSEMNQAIALRRAISSDFVKRFENVRMLLARQIHDSNDQAFKDNGELTMKKITVLIGKLKTVGFKSSLMTEASEHFSNPKFMSLLDTNGFLTGVTNGILEVSGDNVIFRHAKPEDYVSMCTNIPYHSHFNWEHPLVRETMKWLGQVFTDKNLLHHFLKFAASCLQGRNSDKIFPIWTGEGDNSKSMIVKLFESTFSSYCIKFPVELLSDRNKSSSGPSPQLARAKSTRIAFLDEPEDDIPMNKGTIKRYTGGDSFFARLLQENGGDVQATFKMVLMCNKVPIIPNADKAIKNRTRLFPFMSTWVDAPPEDEQEQYRQRRFKKDVTFERRIPILAPAFLWIMSQYYPHYSTQGLADPPIVTETTEAYWRDNDVYAQFAADTIQEVYTLKGDRDESARVTLSEVYAEFKIWFRDAFPGTKVPERTVVRSELSTRWGRMQGNAWHGIRITASEGSGDMTSALGGKGKGPATGTPIIMGKAATVSGAGSSTTVNPLKLEVVPDHRTPATAIVQLTPEMEAMLKQKLTPPTMVVHRPPAPPTTPAGTIAI